MFRLQVYSLRKSFVAGQFLTALPGTRRLFHANFGGDLRCTQHLPKTAQSRTPAVMIPVPYLLLGRGHPAPSDLLPVPECVICFRCSQEACP